MDNTRRSQGTHNPSSANHQNLQRSSTLNRRYVRQPAKKIEISSIAMREAENLRRRQAIAAQVGKENMQAPTSNQAAQVRVASVGNGDQGESVDVDMLRVLEEKQRQLELQKQQILQQRAQLQAQAQAQRRQIQSQQNTAWAVSSEVASGQSSASALAGQRRVIANTAPLPAASSRQLVDQSVRVTNARLAARNATEHQHLTSQELKERAIRQALERVATMDESQVKDVEKKMEKATKKKHFWQKKKVILAAAMSIISVLILGYLVKVNLPDLSVKVAAMQTGIEGSYPSYLPKDYTLDGLVSEKDGRITMTFTGKNEAVFTLTEEKSSWDSSAVLANFVMPTWGSDYVTLKGQGLTIYVSGSNAAWVNGGILYKITDDTNTLTQEQIHDIAVGL